MGSIISKSIISKKLNILKNIASGWEDTSVGKVFAM